MIQLNKTLMKSLKTYYNENLEYPLRKEKIKRLRSYGRKIFNSPLENPIGKKKIKDAMDALKRK